ncbi:hypothetical protein KOW79_007015 [Hemibagrus wyckioides]|uniref:Ig-like domain-containing protein n=2 Tax=Hemibagrus wyckioides TaxID=337641 RepID=A0A9D3NSW9_9TELE|nr:hypothetical protein KOW79_007015 [Hemibagrus wyckioides]
MVSGFWIFVLIVSTMYTVQPGRCWVTAQSPTVPKVYQPDKELSVNIGDSATLQCCNFGIKDREVIWFKQQYGKQPHIMVRFFKTDGEKFYNEFQNSRFQMKQFGNCFNLTISNTTLSDEATYYCALVSTDGTLLKIKGERVNTETPKPALSDNSVVCDPTLHGNNTNMNTQDKTVPALGTALGLCTILIFCLTYFILRRRKLDKMNTSVEESSGMRQESDAEALNYAAIHFTKRKVKADKRKPVVSEDLVYSNVK